MLVGLCAPLLWSVVLGLIGTLLGTEKLDSPGSKIIGIALLPHLPVLIPLAFISPAMPMGAGNDGGFEVMLLTVLTLPSCLFYGVIGWLLGQLRRSIDAS